MAYPEDDYSADIEYNKRYGDNPNAPGAAVVNAVDRSAPYNATWDYLNQAAIRGNPAGSISTTATDRTNLNVAAAMERADLAERTVQPQAQGPLPTVASIAMDEYGQQRQAIDQQRREMMAKLGIIKPQDAGFSAVVMANPRDRHQLLEDLSVLEDHSNRLLREHHYAAMENAQQLHEQTAYETGIALGTGHAKMLQAVHYANKQFGVGTPEAQDYILKRAYSDDKDIRTALGHKALDDILKPYTEMHDLSARRREFVQAFGREPTSFETTATGGVNLRAGEEKQTVPAEILNRYANLTARRAEQQNYLDTDPTASKKDKAEIQKKISALDAQIKVYREQFPQGSKAADVTPTGQIEAGNIDLGNRPVVKNANGSISTVRSIGKNIDGKEVVLPTVSEDGRIMSEDEAVRQYKATGKHLGKFDNASNATAYANQLHQDQAARYGARPLDAAGARAILTEAGGDKDKARVLAKQRGLTF